MPVLNVPFRLTYARNINYRGTFDDNLEPTERHVFRFAVGSSSLLPNSRASGLWSEDFAVTYERMFR